MNRSLRKTDGFSWRHTVAINPAAILLILCFFHYPGYCQHGDTLYLSLDEVIESAITGNPEILLSKLEVQRANTQMKEVQGAFWPSIGIDGQYIRNLKRPVFFLPPGEGFGGAGGDPEGTVIEAGFDNSIQATAQATLPLYNRELFTSARVAEKTIELQEKALDISRNDILAQVKKAYYEALLAKESLEVLQLSLINAVRNYENIQNQFRQELVPQYDVIRAEVQVENVRPDIMQGENAYEAAIQNLKLLANIPEEIPIALEESLEDIYSKSNTAIIDRYSLEYNPQLQQLTIQQALREHQIQLRQSAFFPTLSAFGNYAFQSQANHFNFSDYYWVNTSSVGVQLNIPVFQGLTRSQQIEQARIDLRQTEIQRQYQQRSLSIQAENALNRLHRARKSMEAQERNISQAEKGYQIARVSYSSGVSTLVEVNDAELALTQARLNQLEVIYEFLNALADFNQLTGNQIEE